MLKRIGVIALAMVALAIVLAFVFTPTAAVSASVMIAAPPSRVWAVLADLPDYPKWNPQMRLAGTLKAGAMIENIQDPGPDQIVFWPTILIAMPDRELLWRGHLPVYRRFWLPRLLDADHGFRLMSATGGTLFTQTETLRGLVLWLWDAQQLLPKFQAMDAALKRRAESS